MFIAILGRQPQLGIAEIERVYGSKNVSVFSRETVKFNTDKFDIQRFGGVMKAGKIAIEIPSERWSDIHQAILKHYIDKWSGYDGKITLGISVYDMRVDKRDIQKTGIILKQKLKNSGASLRIVPNQDIALTTATSHHNKLGLSDNKVELIIVRGDNKSVIVAESTGSQNITAYANRDQNRPKRDAFVGMLPPKLAQIMINLAAGQLEDGIWNMENSKSQNTITPNSNSQIPIAKTILDPFCGTGVILQEALLLGFNAYGTDLSEKMIEYSIENLKWLAEMKSHLGNFRVEAGDAMNKKWVQPINAVACESYLGQPFSAPPTPAKLNEVRDNCNHIISEFLKNISSQIESGTPLCIAIPAWRDRNGQFTHLPLIQTVGKFGFKRIEFRNVSQNNLLYYREDQVVARELLVLEKV